MKVKLFILLTAGLLLLGGSAKSLKESVSIRQIETDFPVIVMGSIETERIFGISFPLAFEHKDKFFEKRNMNRINYYYRRLYGGVGSGWGTFISAYQVVFGRQERIRSITSIDLIENESQIIVYTRHRLDTAKIIQTELRPYLEQIIQRGLQGTDGVDTLSVGTFREFRERHPELVKNLLRGDSIEFQLLGRDNRTELDTWITLPIKF